MGVLTPPIQEDLDVSDATFARPDVTTFCRLDEIGCKSSDSTSSETGRRSPAGSSTSTRRTGGAGAAAASASRATPPRAG